MMECTKEMLLRMNETFIDNWAGSVYTIDVAANLGSLLVNIQTPWGEADSYVEINVGASKTYTKGEKIYSVHVTLIENYLGQILTKIYTCYEFAEKLDTVLSLVPFEDNILEEGKQIHFTIVLKDLQNNELPYTVDMYVNGIFERTDTYIYAHEIVAADLGNMLTFQAKFKGNEGFKPSESTITSILIPSKVDTGLSIRVDKSTVEIGHTISFRGTLRDIDGSPIPNKTVVLMYKASDGTYKPVVNQNGDQILASTDISGNYYRPWEPTDFYLDYLIYAMKFDGTGGYLQSQSPDITFNIVAACPIPVISEIRVK